MNFDDNEIPCLGFHVCSFLGRTFVGLSLVREIMND